MARRRKRNYRNRYKYQTRTRVHPNTSRRLSFDSILDTVNIDFRRSHDSSRFRSKRTSRSFLSDPRIAHRYRSFLSRDVFNRRRRLDFHRSIRNYFLQQDMLRRQLVCRSRKTRREVLFAGGRSGAGHRRPVWREESRIICDRR
jgi:hypothetical protein